MNKTDDTLSKLEMLQETFESVDVALRTGDEPLPKCSLYMPCEMLKELTGELREATDSIFKIVSSEKEVVR